MSLAGGAEGVTEDLLLGGRVRLRQPAVGYRAATDPVLLAAAVPARRGDRVLELGCGVGAALYCLAVRVGGLALTGLDIQPRYLTLAQENAELNGVRARLIRGDLAAMPAELRAESFDQVMMNPPFHPPAARPSPDAGRDRAHREETPLAVWVSAGLARLRQKGRLTLIHRAERLPEILGALGGSAGEIVVKPLAARAGRDAKRVLVTARKDTGGPLRLAAPLVIHAGAVHLADRDDFAPEAAAILRDAAPLAL